ncbi:hypothetical protein SDC9_62697 [bioreactor metagenome]|uniref:Uncharacterized protein n=1 Tax=bioreactor metagenome TaxID=1076179 RepID=A0A644XJP1_9ZZZZ
MFYKMSIAEKNVEGIIERMRKVAQFAIEGGELDCHLADDSIVTVHADRSVTISYPPLKFNPDGRPEQRRILAREVLEAI